MAGIATFTGKAGSVIQNRLNPSSIKATDIPAFISVWDTKPSIAKMAKRSRSKSSPSEPLSDIPEDERVNDDEDPEAVGRAGEDSETEDQDGEEDNDEEENEEDDAGANEITKPEKATLKEMQRLKKGKTQEVLEAQNAPIDAEMVESIGSSTFCGDLNDNSESEDQSNGENNAGKPGRKKAKKLLNEEFNQFLISMKAQNEQIKKMFQQTHDLLQKNYEVQLLKAQVEAEKIKLKEQRVKLKEQRVENKILCINLDSIPDPMSREFIRNEQLKIVAKRAPQPG